MKKIFLNIVLVLLSIGIVFTACGDLSANPLPPDDEEPYVEPDPGNDPGFRNGSWINAMPDDADPIVIDFDEFVLERNGLIVNINPSVKHQVMTGFGASDAWLGGFIARPVENIDREMYGERGNGWRQETLDQMADWLFSQEYDDAGHPRGIGLSQWRVNLGAGSEEQGNNARIGVTATGPNGTGPFISDYLRTGGWIQRSQSLLADIQDPFGTTPAVQAGITAGIFTKEESGIVYDYSKMASNRRIMQMAAERGTEYFVLFCNSVPAPWTLNGFTNAGDTNAILNSAGRWVPQSNPNGNIRADAYGHFANYVTDSIAHFESLGLRIGYISPVNEPQYEWNENKQEGSPWLNSEIARIVKEIDEAITNHPVLGPKVNPAEPGWKPEGGTKIMIPEAARWDYAYSGSEARHDQIRAFFLPGRANYVGDLPTMRPNIFAGHTYFSHNNDVDTLSYRTQLRNMSENAAIMAGNGGNPVQIWSTEWCALSAGSGYPDPNTFFRTGLFNAKLTHQDIVIANAVSYAFWTAIAMDYAHARYSMITVSPGMDRHDPVSRTRYNPFEDGHIKTQPTLWATGNYSLFIRPGFQRIGLVGENIDTNDFMGLMGTAYKAFDGYVDYITKEPVDRIVAVFVNMDTRNRRIGTQFLGEYEGRNPRFIRVFMTNHGNTEINHPIHGPASGFGIRRQPHDNGIITIPAASVVTVVYDF